MVDDTEMNQLITALEGELDAANAPSSLRTAADQLVENCRVLAKQFAAQEKTLETIRADLERADQRLTQELGLAEERASEKSRAFRSALLGESIAVKALREAVEKHAATDEPLLLTGPRGAGEEAVANAIHYGSERRERPFVYIDCSRFNADQESSLFGSESWETPDGRAYLADRGTLYMAQVDRLPQTAQWTLREYLQSADACRQKGEPPVPDLRLIVYARRDLSVLASENQFDWELVRLLTRSKLYVPSLSERREDIIPIAEKLLKAGARFYGKVVNGIDPAAKDRLLDYHWPGNMDELDAVIRQSVIVTVNTTIEEMDIRLLGARRLGDYQLLSKLGQGGMGEVWLAKHEGLNRTAAVKLVRPDIFDNKDVNPEEALTRFEREAKVTAMLRSPHTVQLYDFGTTAEGGLYYVMEHLQGMDLDKLVSTHGPLSPARMVHFIRSTALSLAEAHNAGIIHRDIKPANIFSCRMGLQQDFPKVIDFGIVRRFADNATRITAAHLFPGTPEFASPEMVTSPDSMGPPSDLYSLGCTAFYLVTGEPPFKGKGDWAVMMKHTNEAPPAPSSLKAELPAWVDPLILDLMAKKPEDRPASAAALIARLDELPIETPWTDAVAAAWWEARS